MNKKDMIMNNKELREIFVAHVSKNRKNLESAVDKYDDSWSKVRNELAENGMEVTPNELKELTELIRACLDVLDDEAQ
jgi:DNA replication protein DnaD